MVSSDSSSPLGWALAAQRQQLVLVPSSRSVLRAMATGAAQALASALSLMDLPESYRYISAQPAIAGSQMVRALRPLPPAQTDQSIPFSHPYRALTRVSLILACLIR